MCAHCRCTFQLHIMLPQWERDVGGGQHAYSRVAATTTSAYQGAHHGMALGCGLGIGH